MPAAQIYYAVKANPAPEIVAALAGLEANFDLASPGERLKIPTARLPFGNTIKRETASAKAVSDGINLYVFDSHAELEKWRTAPQAQRCFAGS